MSAISSCAGSLPPIPEWIDGSVIQHLAGLISNRIDLKKLTFERRQPAPLVPLFGGTVAPAQAFLAVA